MSSKSRIDQGSRLGREWSALELAEMKAGKYLGQISRPKGFLGRRRIKSAVGSA